MALGTTAITVISALFGFLSEPIKRWQETKRIRHEAKIERIKTGDQSAAELDRLSIAQRGWKDDYLLLITTSPMVLIFLDPFFPTLGLNESISQGFKALGMTPEYYWYALAIVYIDTFGFRRMMRVAVEHWLNNKFGGDPKSTSQKRISSDNFLNQGD